MLKKDTNGVIQFREVGFFKKRRLFRFHTGKIYSQGEYEEEQYDILVTTQQYKPVAVMSDKSKNKTWWMFKNEFYWEDEGFTENEVKALILDKVQQKKRKIENAIARTSNQKIKPANGRQPIPDNVKMFVWQRDNGRCVKCGSQEKLEYDHIIPIAKGGSNTTRNIQLLCEKCNRSKGANLF